MPVSDDLISDLEMSQVCSSFNDNCLFKVTREFEFPPYLEAMVPHHEDRATKTLIWFSALYVGQLKVSLCFQLFRLLMAILNHYNVSFLN